MAGAPSSRPALNHSPEKGKYTGRSWRRSHARSKSKHSRPCRRPLPCPHLSLAFGAQPQRVLTGILIIPHWVADTLRQERDATMPTQTERESKKKKKKGPWMMLHHFPSQGPNCTWKVQGLQEKRFTYENFNFTSAAANFCFFFYVTVKTRRVNLVFMRRKPIRSRGLPSELTAEHVLEAASGRMRSIFLSVGTDTPSSSFPHSGPTRLLAAGTITLPSVNVFPAGVPLISFFLSSSPLTHESTSQFPWSGSLSVKLRLASQPL